MKSLLPLVLIFAVACSGSTNDDTTDVAVDTSPPEDADNKVHHPAWGSALPYFELPLFGESTHVGTQAIEFTNVSKEVGLPTDGGADAVSFTDFDGDGWPDIVASSDNGLTFYRNQGGTFKDVTNDLLLFENEQIRKEGSHTVFADINGDGALDAYVAARGGTDQLLVNDGFGHFEIHDASSLLDAALSVQGVHFADVNNDGILDLYVTEGRRIDADELNPPLENGFAGRPNKLFLGDGSFKFEDVTDAWGVAAGATSETFGGLFADMDRDGDQDLFVTRDFASDHYFDNRAGESFKDATETAIGLDVTSLMGFAVGDYNGDGHLDFYSTNTTHDYLYKGAGDGTFSEVYMDTLEGGDPTNTLTGWGCAFVDLDNDGDQDLISVASYEFSESGAGIATPARIGGFVVLENKDGKYQDITADAGLGEPVNGTSLAMADYDHDGDMDLLVALDEPLENGFGPPMESVARGVYLFRNDGARAAGNNALEISLRADTGNTYAVGAIIDVEAGELRTSRVITAGDSYLSAHSYVQHFGLGAHALAKTVTISWPNGVKQVAHNVPAGFHRMKPFDGECCFPDQECTGNAPKCPLWSLVVKNGKEGDICNEICAHLGACGLSDENCYSECEKSRLQEGELSCAKAAGCDNILSCLEGPDARHQENAP